MKLAIEEAAKSKSEDERSHPRVGVVVVKDGQVVAKAHRGEQAHGEHAEFTALEKKLSTDLLAGATVYTTLEPCTTRNHPKVPCAHRLVERRVRRVVIGMLDPNEQICGRGLWYLRESNIETDLFPHDLMTQIEELNRDFIRCHRPRSYKSPDGTESKDTSAPAVTPPPKPEHHEWELFSSLFDSATRGDFSAAEAAYLKLSELRTEDTGKRRIRLLYLQLRVIHAADFTAKIELEKATCDTVLGEYATTLLGDLSQTVGNMEEAADIFRKAANTAADPEAKGRLALQAADVLEQAGDPEAAVGTLESALSPGITAKLRSQILARMARMWKGKHSPFVKACLLTRAASFDPTASTMFDAAYALDSASLYGLAALQYNSLLKVDPENAAGLNNMAVALKGLGLGGMAINRYKAAAEKGETLAMANIANAHISAGFLDEAEAIIRKARTADDPHQNVGGAMVTLAQQRERETEKWGEIIKLSHRHLKFLNAFADAVIATKNVTALAGPWTVGTSAQAQLAVNGTTIEATWELGAKKLRATAEIFGGAVIGSLEEWSNLWETYESKGTLCMVQKDDQTLWGLLFDPSGEPLPVEWRKVV